MSTVALIINPATVDEPSAVTAMIERRCNDAGWDRVSVRHTTPDDPGETAARSAVAEGAELVLCCGGDGTLASAAAGLLHSDVPMGVLSTGSGNLLSRNLDIPLHLDEALDVALGERTRLIDVGRVDGNTFVVMAGIGLDAAIMHEASDALKERLGWFAYVVAGVKSLRNRAMAISIRIDQQETIRHGRARTVIVGNVGQLQGGLPLLPGADPSDGVLDVVVIAPRVLADWLTTAWRITRRGSKTDGRLQRFRGREIELRSRRPHLRQYDGEVMVPSHTLLISTDPAALLVKVP
ncbi:MAG: diacylglycerol kinase family protein [Mycobacterium sp.]